MTETHHESDAIQGRVLPEGTCFGCGAGNPDGLQLKSYLTEDEEGLVGIFHPETKHHARGNILCGGFVGTLIDCHSLWTAITLAHLSEGVPIDEIEPNFITGEYSVQLEQPTPIDQPVHLNSWIDGDIGKKTKVCCELGPEDEVTATGNITAIRRERVSPK